MGKRFIIGLMVLNVCLMGLSMPSIAQEETVDEIWEFTFGKIVRISKEQVTIMEYNFEQEQEMEGAYEIGESTEFLNVEGLSALRVDDDVEIEFRPVDGKNIIMAIAKDEGESLEELPEDYQDEDMMEEVEGDVSE